VQIFPIASLTCNCVSEKPLVSINVFARLGANTEKVLGLEYRLEKGQRLAAARNLGVYLRDIFIQFRANE
jgi:hypothetical protein